MRTKGCINCLKNLNIQNTKYTILNYKNNAKYYNTSKILLNTEPKQLSLDDVTIKDVHIEDLNFQERYPYSSSEVDNELTTPEQAFEQAEKQIFINYYHGLTTEQRDNCRHVRISDYCIALDNRKEKTYTYISIISKDTDIIKIGGTNWTYYTIVYIRQDSVKHVTDSTFSVSLYYYMHFPKPYALMMCLLKTNYNVIDNIVPFKEQSIVSNIEKYKKLIAKNICILQNKGYDRFI